MASLPLAPIAPAVRRAAKHPRLMHHHRLVVLVLAANAAVLVQHLARDDWRLADGSALRGLADLVVVNFAAAVLLRHQRLLDLVFRLAGRGSVRWPRAVRWALGKVNHIGGLHVGAGVAGTAWLAAFAVVAVAARTRAPATVDLMTLLLACALALLFAVVAACAAPRVRARAHDVFELSHRFGGWTGVALFWVLLLHVAPHPATAWQVWLLALLTASMAGPWLRLRRVPVRIERPSAHAAIVHLDYGVTPVRPSAIGISRNPLREWHAFATVMTPGVPGYRLLISRAGDWTSRFIDDPPSHVWVRGVPVSAPMGTVQALFRRVVYVVTGSGIGPALGQILSPRVPAKLVWSTRDPRATYGDALVDEVRAAAPDALIWDTTAHGKPDLMTLTREAVADFDAEAVFVVSNQRGTWHVVHGMERLGIPAYGPIWDS
jgi:hypothetical protein